MSLFWNHPTIPEATEVAHIREPRTSLQNEEHVESGTALQVAVGDSLPEDVMNLAQEAISDDEAAA